MKTRIEKIVLCDYGSFLGREKGCLLVRDRKGQEKRYPLMNNLIEEVQLTSGNSISTGALVTLGFWGIDCVFLTQRGHPVATLRSLVDDSHVTTRVSQYEALSNGKGSDAAKQFVLGKLAGCEELLKKYGLRRLDSLRYCSQIKELEEKDLKILRNRLTSVEGKFSRQYFSQVLQLFNESFRPEARRTFKAYDGLNNILNLAYRILSWKVHMALIRAKLEPYLGFLHSLQWGTPSLVCDFQEIYRYLVDDFVIEYCRNVRTCDFVLKREDYSSNRKGERQYLNGTKNRVLLRELSKYFETKIDLPRVRRGKKQEIETLINEEALLFAKYLRSEKPIWHPRIVALS
jgi:CRISPR-associated protein Cas1